MNKVNSIIITVRYPFEKLAEEEERELQEQLKNIDWSKIKFSEGRKRYEYFFRDILNLDKI